METLLSSISKYFCCCFEKTPENFTILSNNRPRCKLNCSSCITNTATDSQDGENEDKKDECSHYEDATNVL